MAQLPLGQQIRINLSATEGALSDLPSVAEAPDEWGPWDEDWIEVMARFEWVVDLGSRGQLDPTQEAECERLLRRLRAYLPLTDRLDLPVPRRLLAAMREASPKPA